MGGSEGTHLTWPLLMRGALRTMVIHALVDEAARTSRRPLQFRKWGDELLLPQIIVESGESKPKLVYPAVT